MKKLNFSAWPENRGKCTHLFDYCITYIEDDDSDKGSFVSEVIFNLYSDEISISE